MKRGKKRESEGLKRSTREFGVVIKKFKTVTWCLFVSVYVF